MRKLSIADGCCTNAVVHAWNLPFPQVAQAPTVLPRSLPDGRTDVIMQTQLTRNLRSALPSADLHARVASHLDFLFGAKRCNFDHNSKVQFIGVLSS